MLNRGYSTLDIKSIDDEARIIEGVASSPISDRAGDVLEPKGAVFNLPMPLLWQHRADEPIGQVLAAKVTSKGIEIQAQIAKHVLPRIDEAWALIKSGLVRGLSVGFKPLDDPQPIKGNGLRFTSWEWLELSAVTIPANADARILTAKQLQSFDVEAAAPGGRGVVSVHPPGATGSRSAKPMTKIAEQISAFEATRASKHARMTELVTKRSDAGETLDEAESQEYDGLQADIKQIDAHLVRLHALDEQNKAAAVPVVGTDPQKASASRGGSVITVKSNLPPGTGFTRYAMALAACRGNRYEAADYAKRWDATTPEIAQIMKLDMGMLTKAASDYGTTSDSAWAAPLVVYQNLASEFVELLRPATILGRIPGIRRVPFNVQMPRQLTGSTVGWVGQGKPKPVGELSFDQLSLGMAKAAGIVVISEELARSSSPSAEGIIRQDLIAAIAQFLDTRFIDPQYAAVTNVSPASITNGAAVVDSTGTTAAAFRTDVKTAFGTFTAANISAAGAAWIMTETQALALSMMQNALGQQEFPNITASGGTLFGLPVIASENIPAEGGSPAGNRIILLKPSEILLADDGGVTLDVSREASVQMNTTPDDPVTASTVLISFWQNNLVGLRAERFINWVRRRTEAVVVIEGAVYTG